MFPLPFRCTQVCSIGLLAVLLGCRLFAAPPNVVFIFSDDHAYQAISAYGDARQLIETPHIDRLAREGMRFDRCLVTNSLCGPSRATVLTGTYSHINGFPGNGPEIRFDGSQPTFPKLLQAAGYQTAIVGKWHLKSEPTGFDFWQILPGQGAYYNPRMIRNGESLEVTGHTTDITTDLALDWLRKRESEKPFLLMCQQKAPHRRWEPPLRLLGSEQGRVYPEPETLFDDYTGRGIAERDQDMTIAHTMNDRDLKLTAPHTLNAEQREVWDRYYEPLNADMKRRNLTGRDLVRWKYQRYMHDYLLSIRAVDEGVGRILDYLDETGLAENTIVVYASDQGFFLGEHGWFDKRWIFEESLRTPLLIRWPGVTQPGSVNRDIVSNLDFAETILEAAGSPIPERMQGRSLVPLLRGQTPADWRDSFYYQYFEFPSGHRVRPHYGVVTDRYKLVRFFGTGEDYTELFDRVTDPHELRDVYDSIEYANIRDELTQELARLRRDLHVPADDQIPPHWISSRKN